MTAVKILVGPNGAAAASAAADRAEAAAAAAISGIANITALRAITWPSGRPTFITLLASWNAGDGGGEFRWDAASTATDNGGTIIKEAATATGRWIRQLPDGFVTPEMFGARGDLRVFEGQASIAIGSTTLTQPNAGFTAADVGRTVWVQFAGGSSAPLVTTITAVTNSTTVTLAASASATVTTADFAVGTDDTAAVAAAWNNHDLVYMPGRYGVTSLPALGDGSASAPSTRQNIIIRGNGGTGAFLARNQQRTLIRFFGSGAPAEFLRLNGPIKVAIEGIVFDGCYRVQRGWSLNHHFGSTFRGCRIVKMNAQGIIEEAYPFVSSHTFLGASENKFDDVHVFSPGVAPFEGWRLGTLTVPETGGLALDVSRNSYRNCSVGMADHNTAIGWHLAYCDNNYFDNCFVFTPGQRRGMAFKITAPASVPSGTNTATKAFPLMNTWVGGAWTGGFDIDPTWAPGTAGGGNRGFTFVSVNDGDALAPGYLGTTTLPDHPAIVGFTANGTQLSRRQLALHQGGQISYTVSAVARQTPQVSVSSTTSRTTVWSHTLSAGMLSVPDATPNEGATLWNRIVRVSWEGITLNNTGSPQNFQLRVMSGATVLFALPVVSVPSLAFYRSFRGSVDLSAVGVSNQQATAGSMLIGDGGGAALAAEIWKTWMQTQTGLTLSGSSALPLSIDVQHGSSSQITFLTLVSVELI